MSEWCDQPSDREVEEGGVTQILGWMYRGKNSRTAVQELCFETWTGCRVLEDPWRLRQYKRHDYASGNIISNSPIEIQEMMRTLMEKIEGIKTRIPERLRTFAQVDVSTHFWWEKRSDAPGCDSTVHCWGVLLSIKILPSNFDGLSVYSWVAISDYPEHAKHLYDVAPVVDFPPPTK